LPNIELLRREEGRQESPAVELLPSKARLTRYWTAKEPSALSQVAQQRFLCALKALVCYQEESLSQGERRQLPSSLHPTNQRCRVHATYESAHNAKISSREPNQTELEWLFSGIAQEQTCLNSVPQSQRQQTPPSRSDSIVNADRSDQIMPYPWKTCAFFSICHNT